ncbi:uncharacterized protein BJ212DRAFT_570285 [Suillus subaureus]|uniref:Uncharacterized protein n=1 Tax=Suillus subaureus TaxID=48587 RepID=A0A9P7E4V1_9AGAM|nr:uncharacterized protein BJ212DRAFT_570285 [Suillus subaureus]KAG1810833.1 hypothetical protein BJ212DRAFT_570285 [Suillus subaureus]
MIFTSLTTMVISFAAMAGVAIASDNLVLTPIGLPCDTPNQVGCSMGIKFFNNDDDFAYLCGPKNTIVDYQACSCKKCCYVDSMGSAQC